MAVNDHLNLQSSCEPAPENCEEALSLLAFLEGQDFNLHLTNLCMHFLKKPEGEVLPGELRTALVPSKVHLNQF